MVKNKNDSENEMIRRSRQLRKRSTAPERILWSHLRDRRLAGLKFRRQNPFGKYVLDFFWESHKLAIELDGRSHDGHAEYDQTRQASIEEQGVRVIRFGNDHVLKDIDNVLKAILIACKIPLNEKRSR